MSFAILLENAACGIVRTQSHMTGGDELIDLGLISWRVRRGRQLITGELFADERVERLVIVESTHHVIPIVILCRAELIPFESVRIGVPHDIEPVASPAHTILRVGEPPVNELFVRIGRWVIDKSIDFLRRRRKADQVEIEPANQRAPSGGWRRLKLFFFESGEDECVEWALHPGNRSRVDGDDLTGAG